jgi:hypothetical protein
MRKKRVCKKAEDETGEANKGKKKKKIACHICGETFEYRASRIRHMEKEHGGSKTEGQLKRSAMSCTKAMYFAKTKDGLKAVWRTDSAFKSGCYSEDGATRTSSSNAVHDNRSFDHIYAASVPDNELLGIVDIDLQRTKGQTSSTDTTLLYDNEDGEVIVKRLLNEFVQPTAESASLCELQSANNAEHNEMSVAPTQNNAEHSEMSVAPTQSACHESDQKDTEIVTVVGCSVQQCDRNGTQSLEQNTQVTVNKGQEAQRSVDAVDSYDNLAYTLFSDIFRNVVLEPLPHCNVCQHPFTDDEALVRHIERYKDSDPVQCKRCRRIFHSLTLLNVHIFFDHEPRTTPTCLTCKDKFASVQGLLEHFSQSSTTMGNKVSQQPKQHCDSTTGQQKQQQNSEATTSSSATSSFPPQVKHSPTISDSVHDNTQQQNQRCVSGLTAAELQLDSMTVSQCKLCKAVLFPNARLIHLHATAHRQASKKGTGTSATFSCNSCDVLFDRKYLLQVIALNFIFRCRSASPFSLSSSSLLPYYLFCTCMYVCEDVDVCCQKRIIDFIK